MHVLRISYFVADYQNKTKLNITEFNWKTKVYLNNDEKCPSNTNNNDILLLFFNVISIERHGNKNMIMLN